MPEVQDINGQGQTPDQMDAQTYAQLLAKIKQQGIAGQNLQMQNIQQNLAMQKNLAASPTEVNLSPLMALSDQLYGTNYSKSYKAPQSEEQKQAFIAKLQDEVMKATGQMSDEDVKLLKAQLETQMQKEEKDYKNKMLAEAHDQTAALKNQARNDKLDQQYATHLQHYQDAWHNDKVFSEASQRDAEIAQARSNLQLARSDSTAAKSLPIVFARLAVPSRINEVELKMFGGPGRFTDKVANLYTQASQGHISDEAFKEYSQILDAADRNNKVQLSKAAAQHAKEFSKATKIPVEKAVSELTGGAYDASILTPPPPLNIDSGGGMAGYQVGQIVTDENGGRHKLMFPDSTKQQNWKTLGPGEN